METKFENDPVTPSDWTTEFLGDRTEDWSRGKETRNQDILVKMLNNKHSLQSYHKLFLLLYYINSSKYLVTTSWSIKNVWIAFGYWSSAFQLSDLPVETPKSCRLKNKSVKNKYVLMEIELRFIRKRGRHLGSILFTTLTSVKRCTEVGVTCYNCNIMPLYHLKIPIMYNASKHISIF